MAAGKSHTYTLNITWTGNRGAGTSSYKAYSRDHVISAPGKADISGSSDPAFLGDAARYNPEEMLVAAISTCHMLWYLHLAAEAGIVVTGYSDAPVATMVEDAVRGGWFTGATLRPRVEITQGGDAHLARELHHAAHEKCFVANSLNFPVTCEPEIVPTT